jgi:hypothetical protein
MSTGGVNMPSPKTFQPAKQIGIELIEHAIDLLLQMHHRMRIANQAHGFHLLLTDVI